MAAIGWEPVRTIFCEQAGAEASLEFRLVFPSDHLPDQPARVIARRCSLGLACSEKTGILGCCWTGTNPLYDPFETR